MCNYQIRGMNNSLQKKSPLNIYARKRMETMQTKSQQRTLINGEWGATFRKQLAKGLKIMSIIFSLFFKSKREDF